MQVMPKNAPAPTLLRFSEEIGVPFELVQLACELLGIVDRNGNASASMAVFRAEREKLKNLLDK